MSKNQDQEMKKRWTQPALRRIKLTGEERSVLRASEDPLALLVKMKPDLQSGE